MTCIFCNKDLSVFRRDAAIQTEKWRFLCDGTSTLRLCMTCGWWTVSFDYKVDLGLDVFVHTHSTSGSLRNLDLTDISLPIDELRRYLIANYKDRFAVHPKSYEDIVAGVFHDFGYHVRATSYSGDAGIDVFVFDGQSNDLVGVQVKRWQNSVEAEQIREFAGSLMLNKATKGVYVTTSSYRRGAKQTAKVFTAMGLPIELWNAEAFYDRLKIASREAYNSPDDPAAPFAPFWLEPTRMPEVVSAGSGRG